MTRVLPFLLLLSVFSGCRPQPAESPLIPPEIEYLSRAEWGANDPVLPMTEHEPSRITIHHTATMQDTVQTLAQKLRGLQQFSQSESTLGDGRVKEPWADIPYHLYVDVHGAVGEGRSLQYAGDSNTPYDPSGHLLIVFEGNFEVEALTPGQRRTLDLLVPHLAERYGVTADLLGAHKDFASTLCPGENLYAEIPRLQEMLSR